MSARCPHCTWSVERDSHLRARAALRVHIAQRHPLQPLPPRVSGRPGAPGDTGQASRSKPAGRGA